ncbi:MAG: transcriptional regulator NrdR [Gammaproteobacteria bacterium]|nr:transcriptional regulator NrdR [Gammaproteobacteria bacterium]
MHCPFCKTEETKVIDSRLGSDDMSVRRRRECLHCSRRFNTAEQVEKVFPRIIKRDGRRSNFEEARLRHGMLTALEKRPVNEEQIESALNRIKEQLHSSGEREVPSQLLGQWVMNELRQLDPVAYVRFASVYLSFDDTDAFIQEIKKLKSKNYESKITS